MKELAKLCNVSVSTVSKAFNEASDVSPDTKNRIFEEAKKQGCYHDFYKERYSKKVIAVICPEIISNFYTEYVDTLRRKIEKDNCVCLIATDDFDTEKQQNLIEYFASFLQVDGIIVLDLQKLLEKDYKTPVIFGYSSNIHNNSVKIDKYSALKQSINLLLNNGHKHIAFFTEPLTEGRSRIFKSIMESLNHKDFYIIESQKRFEKCGEECVGKLPKEVTAIICGYDNIALGAIKALKKRGISVPDDISIIGIDNIKEAEYSTPPLTTIGTNTKKWCSTLWTLLKKKMGSPYYKPRTQPLIEAELFIRESVAKNPHR